MADICKRLKKLEANLVKTNKPNAALVCSDARDEILKLRAEIADRPASREENLMKIMRKAGFSK